MVRLSIVLNGLNTAKLAAFKECLMTFQEKLKATLSLAIIPSGVQSSLYVCLSVYISLCLVLSFAFW